MGNTDRADEVRSTRKAQGLTQAQLGERSGMNERTIRNMERGENVAPATERAVYKALGMDPPPPSWPDDVEAFLQMVGFRLTSLDEDMRMDLIGRITRMLIGR